MPSRISSNSLRAAATDFADSSGFGAPASRVVWHGRHGAADALDRCGRGLLSCCASAGRMNSVRLNWILRLGIWWVAVLAPAFAATPSFTLSQEGRPAAAILVAERAADPRRAIAEELQRWLREVVGSTLPIETGRAVRDGIVIGTATDWPEAARRERVAALGPEGFVLRSESRRLWVLANTELGLQHAVYALLEEAGCRWFFPDPVWTVVPRQPTLALALDRRERPAFSYRRIWYGWGPRTPKLRADYAAWQKHNRQLGAFQVRCGHAYEAHVPARKFFETHPDWFALVKGKRQPTQLCTSHTEVQQRGTASVLEAFRKDPALTMVSVEPNDGGGYCECDGCVALGSVSDRVFHLANVVARGVRREFPDKWVGLLAYAFHSDPPRFRLEPGVYVQVTAGFRYTPMTFDEQVRAFRRLGARPGVYDYFSVYPWDLDQPGRAKAGRPYQLGETIRHYRELGLTTFDAESSCNWGPNGPGYWIAAHMMWNPALDARELMRDFCGRAFGRAAAPMQRLYDRWAGGQRPTPRVLKRALEDLRQAYAAENDAAVRARLDRVAMYLHWLRLGAEFDRRARLSRDGGGIAERAQPFIVWSRRIMDTGLIHAFPLLFSEWFKTRLGPLQTLQGFDMAQTELWKKAHTDIPTAEETAAAFGDDLQHLAALDAVEIGNRAHAGPLVPLAERWPAAAQAWGDVKRSPLFLESGEHVFLSRRAESLRLRFTPFPGGHTMDCHWKLTPVGATKPLAEGHVKAAKGEAATAEVRVPGAGVFLFDPGTAYWKAAQIEFDPRPLSLWCGRPDEPLQPRGKRKECRFWSPRLDPPLYFFVPRGTEHFVVGVPAGSGSLRLRLRTADGATVVDESRVAAGDEISVRVPPGKDGAVWSLGLTGRRISRGIPASCSCRSMRSGRGVEAAARAARAGVV